MEPLDPRSIALRGAQVRVVAQCASTNSVLLEEGPPQPTLLAAETQTAGRGRRGRRWRSAPGAGITFSLARLVARPQRELAGLSLVAGVAAAQALRALGAAQVSLKWPNDLLARGAKLGGILVETRMQRRTPLAVVGIGINYLHDEGLERGVRRPIAFLQDLLSPLPSRNLVIRRIGEALLDALRRFDAGGLEALREDWLALHAHAGLRMRVRLADGRSVTGIASGLEGDGSLQLRTRSGVRAIRSGRVLSARPA